MMFGNNHPPLVCQGAAKEVDLVTPHPVNMKPRWGNGETLGRKPREMPRKSVEPRSINPGPENFLGYLGSLMTGSLFHGLCFIIPI